MQEEGVDSADRRRELIRLNNAFASLIEMKVATLKEEEARLRKELRKAKNRMRGSVFNVIILQILTWTTFLLFDKKSGKGIPFSVAAIVALLLAVPPVVKIIKERGKNWVLATILANAFLLVWCDFSIAYWEIGTTNNFSENLSRLDAMYFSLGTLTTAGTGQIAARSELAIGVVIIQMLVDLLFFSVLVTLGVSRLGEALQTKTDTPRK